MKIFENKLLFNRIKASSLSAIWHTHHSCFMNKKKPDEPTHVASFIVNGLPFINKEWKKILRSYSLNLQITGVFCHLQPQVSFFMNGKKKTVELADLLIVRRHMSQGKIVKEVATLIQSKMSEDSTKIIQKNDGQYYLYENWPEFQFTNKNEYTNEKLNIGTIKNQCNYSLIKKDHCYPENNFIWPDGCNWSIVDNLNNNMNSDVSFATFLEELFSFKRGREFYLNKDSGCDWSKTISELLNVTFNKNMKTKLYSSQNRGNTVHMFYSSFLDKDDHTKNFGSGGNSSINIDNIDRKNSGISTILIETSDDEIKNEYNSI